MPIIRAANSVPYRGAPYESGVRSFDTGLPAWPEQADVPGARSRVRRPRLKRAPIARGPRPHAPPPRSSRGSGCTRPRAWGRRAPVCAVALPSGSAPSVRRPCENSGGDGDGGLGHHDLRRSHVIWRFGAGSPAEGAPGLGGSMWGARFWLDSRLMPSRRRSRREHLPARSRGGCCKPAP